MNKHNRIFRTPIAIALGLGIALGAGQAFAADPPRHHDAKAESQEPVSDTWITTKVKADLVATKNVPGTDVKVETVNGVVSLSGVVPSKAEHDKAVQVAKGIKGVKSVDASGLTVSASARN
ncbi:BON domain-containing protein [Stenotrophomonas sp. MMGLT7]|uniref:BON domain-containing protein n=1 Tax=Stenotrophomonas sp. MMGLT7 TaxID=2901227 RepID=UPI001E4F7C4A|nr:BON domain-containing protein [Stenotrophomonas sp. MMGLT7]MCD7099980.1 BON domain-containing protein [Stenotrophomonas sp. MMGLT7]